MPGVYGNSFSDLMAAEASQDARREATSQASINRLVGVMQNLRQTEMQRQAMEQHAKSAASELAMRQQQLDLQKKTFAEQVTRADQTLQLHQDQLKQTALEHADNFELNMSREAGLNQRNLPQNRFQDKIIQEAQTDADLGVFDPKKFGSALTPEQHTYFGNLSQRAQAEKMADFAKSKDEESVLNLAPLESAKLSKMGSKPSNMWGLRSKAVEEWETQAEKAARLANMAAEIKKRKDFSTRFIPLPNMTYRTALTPPASATPATQTSAPAPVTEVTPRFTVPEQTVPQNRLLELMFQSGVGQNAVAIPNQLQARPDPDVAPPPWSIIQPSTGSAQTPDVNNTSVAPTTAAPAAAQPAEGQTFRDRTTGFRYRVVNGRYVRIP